MVAAASLALPPHSNNQNMKINFLQFIAAAAVAISLAACGGGGTSDASPAAPSASGPVTVEILGDSITLGIVEFSSPVMRMRQQRPDWQLVDRSAGGLQLDTLITGYTEPWPGAHPIYFPMGPQKPFVDTERTSHFVVVGLGVNDYIHNGSELEAVRYEHNLRYVIRTLLSEKRVPIITGLVRIKDSPPLRDRYNEATRKIAKEYRLVHAGWGEAYGLEGVGDDTIHPHQASSDVIAGLLISAVDEAIAKNARGEFQWSFENWAGNHY